MSLKLPTLTLPKVVLSIGILTLALFVLILLPSVMAQLPSSSRGLEISPPLKDDLRVDPGKTVEHKVKVTNKSTADINIKVRVNEFTAAGEGGQVALKEDSALASWVTFTPESFALKGGETKEVTLSINPPANAAGTYSGSVVFSVVGDTTPGAAAVSQEVASLFLVTVNGPTNEGAMIQKISAPQFVEFGPVPVMIEFKNTGNVYVKPYGLITVTDMFGRTVKNVVVKGQNILPNAARVVTENIDTKFLVGQYKTTAILYYGAKNQSLTATTTFWAFPVRIVAIAAVVLVGLYLIRRRLAKALRALSGK